MHEGMRPPGDVAREAGEYLRELPVAHRRAMQRGWINALDDEDLSARERAWALLLVRCVDRVERKVSPQDPTEFLSMALELAAEREAMRDRIAALED